MRALRLLACCLVACVSACAQDARPAPAVWRELEEGKTDLVTTRAAGLLAAWADTAKDEHLQAMRVLVDELRSYPAAKPADRALTERLAGEFLALANPAASRPVIAAVARLADQLLSEDAWTVVQPAAERAESNRRLAAATVPFLRLVAANAKPGWKPPRLHDPRAGAGFGGDTPRVIDPAQVAAFEEALRARSVQRAWNDALLLLKTSVPLAAERTGGGSGVNAVIALLQACGVGTDEAVALARVFAGAEAKPPAAP